MDRDWQRILRLVAEAFDEAFEAYLTKLPALRQGVIADLKRKLTDGGVLDRSRVEQSSRGDRPTSAAQRPRPKGSRKRRS